MRATEKPGTNPAMPATRKTKKATKKAAKKATKKPVTKKPATKKAAKKVTKKATKKATKKKAAKKPPVKNPALAATGYWLMKSEPDAYSIDDLARDKSAEWDGIRNYQARNFMRDDMRVGDWVFFYHSNAKPPGVVGLARVCKTAYPDHTAFDPGSKYHDPKSDPANPRWVMVDVEFVEKFADPVSLEALKAELALAEMLVVQRGQRLSIQPVQRAHFEHVLTLAGARRGPRRRKRGAASSATRPQARA